MTAEGDITDQAIAWHVRRAELTQDGWHRFVEWLEADPAHARAYDRVALDDGMLAGLPMKPERRRDVRPQPWRRWAWAGGAVAVAATGAAVLLPTVQPRTPKDVMLVTAPGARRAVQLADGTRIEMSGGTTLRLRAGEIRSASLDAGEAVFHVRHDARRPFVVRSGSLVVQDMGTVFDVMRMPGRLDVAVAEGSVLFQPGNEALTLNAGEALSADERRRTVTLTHVAPEAIGGWRSGRLVFTGQSIGAVFAAVQRMNGSKVTLAPDLSARPFTGMMKLSGVAEKDIPHIAAMIGARWRRNGERWILSPADTTAR